MVLVTIGAIHFCSMKSRCPEKNTKPVSYFIRNRQISECSNRNIMMLSLRGIRECF